jgi:hypothetical protein
LVKPGKESMAAYYRAKIAATKFAPVTQSGALKARRLLLFQGLRNKP